MSLSLAKWPLEILAQVTSHLEAQDVILKLGAAGNFELLARLRNGGITSWIDRQRGPLSTNIKFVRHLRNLITVDLDISPPSATIVLYMLALPPTLRHLSIQDYYAADIFRPEIIGLPTWDRTLLPLSYASTAHKIWIVRDTFPILETLRVRQLEECNWGDELSLTQLLLGLPATLTYLDLPFSFKHGSLDLFQLLPPNITKLSHHSDALPTSRHSLDALAYLKMHTTQELDDPVDRDLGRWTQTTNLDLMDFPSNLTHLVIPTDSPLLTINAKLLPATLTNLDVYRVYGMGGDSKTLSFFQLLRLLPPSITSATIGNLKYESPTESSLQQLGMLQPFAHLKTFEFEFQCEIAPELESTMWKELIRLVPNVISLDVIANSVDVGVTPNHLKLLNPLSLRSLKVPFSAECFTLTDGASCIQSLLPNLTHLWLGRGGDLPANFDFAAVPRSVTSVGANAQLSVKSLVHLPKNIAHYALENMLMDVWDDDICRLFSAVRTSNGELIAVDPNSSEATAPLTINFDRAYRLSIDERGLQLLVPNSERSSGVYFDFDLQPTHLPSSLTELTIIMHWDLADLITAESLPCLKKLSVPGPFAGLEALIMLDDLTLSEFAELDSGMPVVLPPNLTRLCVHSASEPSFEGGIPTSVTHLEAEPIAPSDIRSLSSLQTLKLSRFDLNSGDDPDSLNEWTAETFPTTLTHMSLPPNFLIEATAIDFSKLFQRLSHLRLFESIDFSQRKLPGELLGRIFVPSFPDQAVFGCGTLKLTYNDFLTAAARAQIVPGSLSLKPLESLEAFISRTFLPRAYPRLRHEAIVFERNQDNFTAEVCSTLLATLSPSTSYLELPLIPHVIDPAFPILWPRGLTNLMIYPTELITGLQVPDTLQSLIVYGYGFEIQPLIDALPPGVTELHFEQLLSDSPQTHWPPSLKSLYLTIRDSAIESMKYLPKTLEHLNLGANWIDFEIAEFIPSSVKCLEARVETPYVPALKKRLQEIGCLWVTSQSVDNVDHEAALTALVAHCRTPSSSSTSTS